jgi:5-methylcytosine-specific restriction endonuclease McrA
MDGRRCTVCGATEDLEVHHRDGDPSNDALDNLRSLCPDCHEAADRELRARGRAPRR